MIIMMTSNLFPPLSIIRSDATVIVSAVDAYTFLLGRNDHCSRHSILSLRSNSNHNRIKNMVTTRRPCRQYPNQQPIATSMSSSSTDPESLRGGGEETNDDTTTTTTTTASSPQPQQQALQGRVLLIAVAMLYGTLNVSLRLVYQLETPPTAAALSATRGWLAAACFVPLLLFQQGADPQNENGAAVEEEGPRETTATTTTASSSSSLWLSGLELAVWNFLAQGLLNIGLLSTGSARASFLTQTSVVLTPILSLLCGHRVAKVVWWGCALALGGLTLLSSSSSSSASSAASWAFSKGDWWVLGGALSWSIYLFRLSQIGHRHSEIQLQGTKTALLAVLYSIWLLIETLTSTAATSWSWMGNWTVWAALLYSAFGPGMLADVLQQQGQTKVSSAAEANVLLSLEPVFAALLALALLGEVTSRVETVGGGLIVLAALLATSSGDNNNKQEPDAGETETQSS